MARELGISSLTVFDDSAHCQQTWGSEYPQYKELPKDRSRGRFVAPIWPKRQPLDGPTGGTFLARQEEGASFIGKDRSYGWQLSLQGKDGNYANDATKEVAERIPKNKEEKSRLSETNSEPDFRKVHAKGTSHSPLPNPMLPLGKGGVVVLAVDFKSNVVAKGIVYEELGRKLSCTMFP
ncbi:hypothetical protein IFM89_023864 [Coptis chinensis]|uniref:Uncharacterized protein n=1 Tax=Coptis chinensis TaxID=261450 RepID=A0A835ICJ0_9MAGN|nr:hypothetical protein IFM89_023864 [Coptis chinensis]